MIYVGSIGIRFLLTVVEDGAPLDLSGFTQHDIVFIKPDHKTEIVVAGTFLSDGTDGKIYCDSPAGIFDCPGKGWTVRARLGDSSHLFYADPEIFEVGKL